MTEYFDVLDKKGNKTGEVKSRVEVHRDGDWHKSIHVWVINSQQELLVQKRATTKDSFPNLWDVSVGGHVSAGEDSLETAVREVSDELNLDVGRNDFEHVFSVIQQSVSNHGAFINNEYNDVYFVYLDVDVNRLTLQSEEVAAVKFIHYLELERMIQEDSDQFVPHRQEYQKLFEILHQRFDKP